MKTKMKDSPDRTGVWENNKGYHYRVFSLDNILFVDMGYSGIYASLSCGEFENNTWSFVRSLTKEEENYDY